MIDVTFFTFVVTFAGIYPLPDPIPKPKVLNLAVLPTREYGVTKKKRPHQSKQRRWRIC